MSNMAKIVMIVSGIIVLLNLGGVETNSGSLISGFLENGLSNFANSDLWSDLMGILIGVGISSIVIGAFGRSPDINLLLGTITATFAGIVLTDMLGLFNMFWTLGGTGDNGWIRGLASAIFIPLVYGFFVVVINFWRGNDN